jgi:hypothetical protein
MTDKELIDLARNPNTSEEVLFDLVASGDTYLIGTIALRRDISVDLIRFVSDRVPKGMAIWVVENPVCPTDIIMHHMEDIKHETPHRWNVALAQHPNCPIDLMYELYNFHYLNYAGSWPNEREISVAVALAENPNCPTDLLISIAKHCIVPDVMIKLVKNLSFPVDLAVLAAVKKQKHTDTANKTVIEAVLERSDMTGKHIGSVLDAYGQVKVETVIKVCENTETPSRILHNYHDYPNPVVRMKVAGNPNIFARTAYLMFDNGANNIKLHAVLLENPSCPENLRVLIERAITLHDMKETLST